MKNKKNMIGLTMLLSATVMLGGCGSSKALEREQAYRQIGGAQGFPRLTGQAGRRAHARAHDGKTAFHCKTSCFLQVVK